MENHTGNTEARFARFRHGLIVSLMAVLGVLSVANGVSAAPAAGAKATATVTNVAISAAAININTASAEEIADALSGVGMKKAQDIVQYRQDFGAIRNLEDLKKIRGIGEYVVSKNASLIKFE